MSGCVVSGNRYTWASGEAARTRNVAHAQTRRVSDFITSEITPWAKSDVLDDTKMDDGPDSPVRRKALVAECQATCQKFDNVATFEHRFLLVCYRGSLRDSTPGCGPQRKPKRHTSYISLAVAPKAAGLAPRLHVQTSQSYLDCEDILYLPSH